MPRFGLYYYSWYHAARWKQHERLYTPTIGEYDSSSPLLQEYHIGQLKKLGIDYVIIELLPLTDWDFQRAFETNVAFTKKLKAHGIDFTFLIDMAVGTGYTDCYTSLETLFAKMHEQGMESTVQKEGRPLLFFFSTTVPLAYEMMQKYKKYSFYIPIFLPSWKTRDDNATRFLQQKGVPIALEALREESLPIVNHIPFWTATEDIFNVHGFASIVPGYDDTLLHRDPQLAPVVERKSGKTLVDQFQKALEIGAEDILLYGFNEYFESTTIEPTLEYGNFYMDLLQQLIAQAKKGDTFTFSFPAEVPKPVTPCYLSKELKKSAQFYEDALPRWDQDHYKAYIEPFAAPSQLDRELMFKNINITNQGTKPWIFDSQENAIHLGAKIIDASGAVLQEGRALLPKTIEPGQKITLSIKIEIDGIKPGEYLVEVDMVNETKFWFKNAQQLSITLF